MDFFLGRSGGQVRGKVKGGCCIAVRAAVLLVLALGGFSCAKEEAPRTVSLENRETAPAPSPERPRPLRIAVGGMITPREGFRYYREFLLYIGEKLGRPVEYVDRENYAEVNRLVETGDVDVAFVCGGPYVEGHRKFGMRLLAAPRAYGGTVYHSYIIVRKNSPIKDFRGLRGRRFAFTDPLSNTGKLVPTYMLAKIGETPESFFEQYIFTMSHDRSIRAVSEGVVDGAAVDSLVWEYLARKNPGIISQTRIIERSPPYGIPPVVVTPTMGGETRERLKEIFLTAHEDGKGRAILEEMMIERFVPISDSAYDSIRRMNEWLEKQKRRGR